MKKREKAALLARIIRMELSALCRNYFTGETEEEVLSHITAGHLELVDAVAGLLTDEQYVLLHNLLVRLQEMKQQKGEEGKEQQRSLLYRYMNLVYLEYQKEMNTPEDYFLLADRQILLAYNRLADRRKRVPARATVYDTEGKPLYMLDRDRVVAYGADGAKLCDTVIDAEGNVGGWKKTGSYAGEFADGLRNGNGVEYYDVAGCSGIRREGIWQQGEFISGKEYGILLYRQEEEPEEDTYKLCSYEIKMDFDGKVLHKDLDYVWDVIMGDGESARYYFADVILENGVYEILEDTIRPAIV